MSLKTKGGIMGVRDYTIYDVICRNAQIYPDRDAIVYKDIRLTHKAYKQKCDQVASGLKNAGVHQGDRIGIVAHNSDEYMILYGAAAKIGAIIVAVNWRFQADEVHYVLNDCTPKLVFAGSEYVQTVSEVKSKIKSIETCYTIGTEEIVAGFLPFSNLYEKTVSNDIHDISMDAGYVIIHTAAVEGKPRGALLSHGNLIYSGLITMKNYNLGIEDCHICVLPLFHVAGLNLSLAMMQAGGKNAILERFDPVVTLQLIENEKGTALFNFAAILGMIMEAYEKKSYNISTLKHVTGMDSGENIMKFLKLAPHARYYTGFGQTEAMGVSGCPLDEKPGSAGKPTFLAKVALFDDHDKEVPVGQPGEICVKSPTVFLGYWGLEEETEYTFRNGWHHTGDIGKFDEEGYLWYVKRKAQKELIKPGGENVYPAEVEKTILEHDAIQEVSVIGVADKKWGEAIKSVCVLETGKEITEDELKDFVAQRIARYKKPQIVVFVDSLPKDESGEIDRDKVKKDHGAKY